MTDLQTKTAVAHDEEWLDEKLKYYASGSYAILTRDAKKAAAKYSQHVNSDLIKALHDAIRRPMGVVPDSAQAFISDKEMELAEYRRAQGVSDETR